jgi:hypothetical protein
MRKDCLDGLPDTIKELLDEHHKLEAISQYWNSMHKLSLQDPTDDNWTVARSILFDLGRILEKGNEPRESN